MKNLIALLLILLTIVAGVLIPSYGEVDEEPQYESEYREWKDSHQFNGGYMMGHMNATNLTFNNSGEIQFDIDIVAYFEKIVTMEGYVNVSILSEGEEIISYQTNESISWKWTIEGYDNLTIRVIAVGSDTHPDSDFGDYYILELSAVMETKVE